MATLTQLIKETSDLTASLHSEGFLDEQFTGLQNLQDANSPDFVVDVVTLFFGECEKHTNDMTKALDSPIVDFKQLDSNLHRLKGSSSSVGAARITNLCVTFRTFCDAQSRQDCVRCLIELERECAEFKKKLETLFALEKQVVAAGGSVPVLL